MKHRFLSRAAEFLAAQRRRKRWVKVVSAMAAVVVFCTTYALILPAITMETDTICGLEAHTHSDACYTVETITPQPTMLCSLDTLRENGLHEHDKSCYDNEGNLVCGFADFVVHQHDETCYDLDGNLICTLEEIEEHQHDASCYWEEKVLACGQAESAGHQHSEDCYTLVRGDLICGEDHEHSDACYQWDQVLTCGKAEAEGHSHTADCYETEWVLVCDKPEVELHEHDEDCYEENPDDPDGEPVLVCGKTVVLAHQHGDGCVQPPEGEPYEVRTLTCGKEEHQHVEACYLTEVPEEEPVEDPTEEPGEDPGEEPSAEEPAEEPAGTPEEETLIKRSYLGPDYTVTVSYGADAALPEGVALKVREIEAGTEEYQAYYDQTVSALGAEHTAAPETLVFARFFDVAFQAGGETFEPAAPVAVTITYDTVDTSDAARCKAIHFGDEGTELLDVQTENLGSGETSFTHTQESFSVVGSLVTVNYSTSNSTEVGPNLLPVDYYVCIDGTWTCVGSTKTGWYGDYTATDWSNTNRDCITVAQANSVLGKYGFDTSAGNAALQIAYQRKETDKEGNLHCDTQSYTDTSKSSAALIPLARNENPQSGYNLYFLPGNTNNSYSTTLTSVNTDGSKFYTVSVYDPNHLAYAAGEALPETQTVKTGGSAEVTVKALGESSGASWQCVDSSWAKVADGTAAGDGTITFSLTNITQQLRITPMTTELGTEVNKTVYYLVFLDGEWTEVGTTTPYYDNSSYLVNSEGKHRYFVTSTQAESVLGPFGFRSQAYSSTVNGTSVLAHQLGKYDSNTQFWTDGGGQKLADGSWAIGLSYTDNVQIDYSLYYLPVNPESFQGKYPGDYTSDSPDMIENRFWSVTVRDDGHSVYSDGELSGMVQYVQDGGEAVVTVENAEGVLWSCVGKNGDPVTVETSQSGGSTTFTITSITQPIEVTATRANPSFTVQYYANIPRFATSGSNALTVIDTSGKALPTNGGSMATRSLYLEGTGQTTSQNAGASTQLYRIATTTELTKMYTEKTYQYESSPGLEYFNKLKDNESYTLKEIWVLKSGKDPASTNREDWDIYPYSADTAFTNEAGQATGNTILLSDGAVIRLVSDSSMGNYFNGTTFYDYNISSGQNSDGRWRTGITGINSESNYGTSSNGQRTWRSGADILAFGNANCGTGMSGYLFDGSTLNKYSSKNSGYGGATFGLASGLNSDGTIRYNEWIVAPKLFNDGDATGKQTYSGSTLTFDRVGDTYTLSAATLANSNGQSNTLSGLQYFFNPSPTSGTTHTHIFTNNFWPMDPAAGRTDALWGAYNNPGSFQGFTETNNYNWGDLPANFPVSDDGRAHNWFFGMNFALSFNLTADYEGPLEYYFFGDDDLWVFLDGKLVCDIGGVHSSIGEFVNLRDYLPVGSSGQHTLTFFYTERGASGSTCYMSFTLPSVSSATTSRDTGSLQIEKTVESDGDFSDAEYQFQVELLTSENGSPLNQTFSYGRSDGTYGTIKSGGTITLKRNETITISGIPAGTFYRVTELSTAGYQVAVNGNEGYIVSGKIETGAIKPASFVNTPYYELPSTGGPGTLGYTLGGLAVMAGAFWIYKNQKGKRGRDGLN